MCEVCVDLCKEIERLFGHRVNPNKLTSLIESSPLVDEDTGGIYEIEEEGIDNG